MSCRVHGARRSNLSGQGVKHADKAWVAQRKRQKCALILPPTLTQKT